MSDSKTSNQKKNKNTERSYKKVFYAALLLFGANIIVFAFFGYFMFLLFSSQKAESSKNLILTSSLPALKNNIEINPTAVSFIVYDPLTRTTIYSKNPNIRLSPASSIKILTALVALDNYSLDQYLPAQIASYDESKVGLVLGEMVKVEDLLHGLLLISGNDAAKTLSYNYPGGTEGFIKAMNDKAREIGLTQSYFIDPSGYMDNNYSTAFEMARLGAYAMENKTLRTIVGTQEKVIYDKNFNFVHPLTNLNELLSNKNVTGIKTGFTNEAGGVLITSYNHLGRELIIVVMKSKDRFADTRLIMSSIKDNVVYLDAVSSI